MAWFGIRYDTIRALQDGKAFPMKLYRFWTVTQDGQQDSVLKSLEDDAAAATIAAGMKRNLHLHSICWQEV